MSGERTRDCIIAVGAAALLVATAWIWQAQVGYDIPPIEPGRWLAGEPQRSAITPGIALPPAPAQRATPDQSPGNWLSDNDYPAEAARRLWSGTANFTLVIGTSGAVEGCLITLSTGHAILDEATCATLTRGAHFRPGRDRAGAPARDSYSGRISWRLPDRPAPGMTRT